MLMHTAKLCLHFTTIIAGLILAASLHAQPASGARRPTRVPVTIVQVAQIAQGNAAFTVQRRRDIAPHDVILLREDANPGDLSDAIRTLLIVRQANGDTAAAPATFRARPGAGPQQRARTPLPWVGRVLSDLQNSVVRDVPGYGRAKAVEIWLPPQRRSALAH